MKRYQQQYRLFNYLLGTILFGILLLPQPVKAVVNSPLDLATIPLANSPTVVIQPNLLYVLDDSGSMDWAYMPDTSTSTNISWKENASYNTMAYNPATRYLPPAFFDAGGVNTEKYPSQTGVSNTTGANNSTKPNWRAVESNAYATGATGNKSTSTNLEGRSIYFHIVAGEYCTGPDLKSCVAQATQTDTHSFAAPLRWCSSSSVATGAATPAAGACQATRTSTFNSQRAPTARISTITVANNNDNGAVSGITVDGGMQIMSGTTGTTSDSNTLASRIAASINDCTYAKTGNCATFGYFATVSDRVVTLYASNSAALSNISAAPVITRTGKSVTANAFSVNSVPGKNIPVVITSAQNSYTLPGSTSKAQTRTDCLGDTCSYVEEMTNYANWWTYYQTRMQTMKTATSLAFKDLGESFRVGLMTINTTAGKSLNFDTFNTTQKAEWYKKLFATPASGGTPLRQALARAGRIYAAKDNVSKTFTDPIEYECQQNFTLLTTDGFWNGAAGVKVDGSAMTNQDGSGTVRPKYEGPSKNSSTDSLADVAKYYRDTDLRTPMLGNCVGALGSGVDVCQSPPPSEANKKQTMVTLTLGLGVDGTLAYTTDYKTATSGDFYDIRTGSNDWPKPEADKPTAIDDLWHAAVNGDGTYFSAKDPAELTRSLKGALASIEVKLGAGAAAATSTLNPVAGDNFAYVASYTTGHWTGNLEKRAINTNPNDPEAGSIGTETLACVEDVGTCIGALRGKEWNKRKIYTSNGSERIEFSYDSLSSEQKANFEPDFLAANLTQLKLDFLTEKQREKVTGKNLVNYLHGQTEFDDNATELENRAFRARQTVLGDVINAKPVFIGKPTFSYVDYGYDKFKSDHVTRAGTVYVAANDGMLHAFDADTLQERWAYIPSMVLPNMWKLADMSYATGHSYYTDGDPVISDVCVSGCGSAGAQWKTILVAGLNGGGRGYYALDITDPTSADGPELLWELDANDEQNLGYTYGNPVITKNPSGKWVVLVTSGYNNIPDNSSFYNLPTTKFKPNNPARFNTGNGKGYLYVLDAATGSKLAEIETMGDGGSTSRPSGLAKITAYAENAEQNNTATYVYGGDLLGNLWRFDLHDNSVRKFAQLQHEATAQPITTRPEIGLIKKNRVLFVGTGKYLEVTDLTNTERQTLYAIKDTDNSATINNPRSGGVLVQQTMAAVGTDKRESTSDNAVNWDVGLGWYIDFPSPGERQHVASNLTLGTLLVPTTVPTASACQPAGYGWLSFFDYRTGLSVLDNGLVSQMFSAPVVGFNVVYIDGKPKVNVVKADNPNPELLTGIPLPSAPPFNKIRSIWRELIP